MKERCEETRREITRKSRKFEEWCDKHIAKTIPTDEFEEWYDKHIAKEVFLSMADDLCRGTICETICDLCRGTIYERETIDGKF